MKCQSEEDDGEGVTTFREADTLQRFVIYTVLLASLDKCTLNLSLSCVTPFSNHIPRRKNRRVIVWLLFPLLGKPSTGPANPACDGHWVISQVEMEVLIPEKKQLDAGQAKTTAVHSTSSCTAGRSC